MRLRDPALFEKLRRLIDSEVVAVERSENELGAHEARAELACQASSYADQRASEAARRMRPTAAVAS